MDRRASECQTSICRIWPRVPEPSKSWCRAHFGGLGVVLSALCLGAFLSQHGNDAWEEEEEEVALG